MATTMTLAELRTAVRQRADMQNQSGIYTNSFVTDEELTSYINQSYFELYDLLVTLFGENYYVSLPYSFVTNGSDQFYNLPTDFYKLLGVDVQITSPTTNNSWWTLKPFNFGERNKYSVPNTQLYFGITNLRYRLQADQIWMNPLPQSNQTIRVWYVPKMTTLVADSDEVQGVSGWTEYIIIDAAIKCMQKEESDVSVLLAQKGAMLVRIDGAAANRDAGEPSTVTDSCDPNSAFPFGSSGGYY